MRYLLEEEDLVLGKKNEVRQFRNDRYQSYAGEREREEHEGYFPFLYFSFVRRHVFGVPVGTVATTGAFGAFTYWIFT